MKLKSPIDQTLNRCKYFTGIQQATCKALVPYATFRKPSGALMPLPCFKDEQSSECCDKAEWYTMAEAQVIEAQYTQAIKEYFAALEEGRCPICKAIVSQRQVGHCVYGSCGHRLYQGTVNHKLRQG